MNADQGTAFCQLHIYGSTQKAYIAIYAQTTAFYVNGIPIRSIQRFFDEALRFFFHVFSIHNHLGT